MFQPELYFPWCDVFGCDDTFVTTGLYAWACVLLMDDRWFTVGGRKGLTLQLLAQGDHSTCVALAEDWLQQHENEASATIVRYWFTRAVSAKQRQRLLPVLRMNGIETRYQATALLHFQRNKSAIVRLARMASETRLEGT